MWKGGLSEAKQEAALSPLWRPLPRTQISRSQPGAKLRLSSTSDCAVVLANRFLELGLAHAAGGAGSAAGSPSV